MRTTLDTRAFLAYGQGTAILRLEGSIRYTAALALRSLVDRVPSLGPLHRLVLDLRNTHYVDSTGLGLIARLGSLALSSFGGRAVLVFQESDVVTVLRSASLDNLFVLTEELPSDLSTEFEEVPLGSATASQSEDIGRVVLDAHRNLAVLSLKNLDEYRNVIAALEVDLMAARRPVAEVPR